MRDGSHRYVQSSTQFAFEREVPRQHLSGSNVQQAQAKQEALLEITSPPTQRCWRDNNSTIMRVETNTFCLQGYL